MGCAPCWPAYRDAGAGPGSGHRLLLLLRCLTLDGLEVVERWGEIVHQPLPLEFLLPLDHSRGGRHMRTQHRKHTSQLYDQWWSWIRVSYLLVQMVTRPKESIPDLSGTCWSLSPPGWCNVVSAAYGESMQLQHTLTQTRQNHSDQHFILLSRVEKYSKRIGKKQTKHSESKWCSVLLVPARGWWVHQPSIFSLCSLQVIALPIFYRAKGQIDAC